MTHTLARFALALTAVVMSGCAAAPPPATATPRVAAVTIDSLLRTPPLHRAHWGVAAVDADTGEPVFELNADRLFITASNMKLVTVAAALALLGPEYRFVTEVTAEVDADGTARRVVVRGSGDPSFSTSFHDRARAPLDSLADSLFAAGLRRVDGAVVVDGRRFEPVLVHPAWEVFDLDWYYASPVAPFAIEEAAIPIVVTPGRVGEAATVEVLEVADLVGLDAAITTVDGERGWNDQLRRYPDADSLTLGGTIGVAAGADTSRIAQTAPGRLAGRALVVALERAGVDVRGAVVSASDPGTDTVTAPTAAAIADVGPDALASGRTTPVRAAWRSPPLVELIRLPLEESDNWVTELLLKTIGAEVRGEGSWSAGTAAADSFLTRVVGAGEGSLYMRDGSGLTAQNLVTPAALVALLRYVDAQPWGEPFRAALAGPGVPGGTLETRLLDQRGRVAAKTGTIRHVNSLSGYATSARGRELVFSILSNASGLPASAVRPVLDRILETLLDEGSRP